MEANFSQKSMSRFIVKTMGYTILGVLSCFTWLCMALTVFVPKTAAQYYDYLGLNQAEVFCYETEYARTQKIEDLYNVILVNLSAGNEQKALDYIQEIQQKTDYAEFSKTLDASAFAVTSIDKIAYTASVQSYFAKKQIQLTYKIESKEQAKSLAINFLTNVQMEPYFYATTAYIDCVYQDSSLTLKQVYAQLAAFADTFTMESRVYDIMLAQAEEAYTKADSFIGQTEETAQKQRAIYLYKSLELYQSSYMLAYAQCEVAMEDMQAYWQEQKQILAQSIQTMQSAYTMCIQGE